MAYTLPETAPVELLCGMKQALVSNNLPNSCSFGGGGKKQNLKHSKPFFYRQSLLDFRRHPVPVNGLSARLHLT